MSLENQKKNWKDGAKEKIWTTYYGCQMIFTKNGIASHGASFDQHLKSHIVFLKLLMVPKG
jgi:hypothetical protein